MSWLKSDLFLKSDLKSFHGSLLPTKAQTPYGIEDPSSWNPRPTFKPHFPPSCPMQSIGQPYQAIFISETPMPLYMLAPLWGMLFSLSTNKCYTFFKIQLQHHFLYEVFPDPLKAITAIVSSIFPRSIYMSLLYPFSWCITIICPYLSAPPNKMWAS